MYYKSFVAWLGTSRIMKLLFIINFLGTIYGYYWYKNQLAQTPLHLWPFVPDSPTASLFFTVVLLAFILGERWPLIQALAAVTLFKYGIWATVMILWSAVLGAQLGFDHYMLMTSHVGMAIQAILYASYFTFTIKHLALASAWTLFNDFLDYTLHIFPWVHRNLYPYLGYVAGFTVTLSVISILLFYWLVLYKGGKNKLAVKLEI
ncbi:DUF1405 domain-containing protein [Bacillus horti]|uniref:Membrane protein YpjA n=1 Tax=Caldalkalibacillus horti TaxID=77523 RepID=A0ABT9VWX7_9BACI|nr:DUF1405 domain-containing protein [Bacillus horti]MDQ0165493.1 putative membrane protein YpjA [Bacillus horti]